MRTYLLMFLIYALGVVTAAEFQVWCCFTADDPKLKLIREDLLLHGERTTPYLAVRNYPAGGKSHLCKLRFEMEEPYPGSQRSFSFVPTAGKSLLFLFDALGEIHSTPDTYCAFVIRPSENAEGRFALRVWNYNHNVNREYTLAVCPGQWQLCQVKLNGPGFLEDGDLFKNLSIIHTGTNAARNWQLDKIVVWQGTPPPPRGITSFQVENQDEANHLSWQAPVGEIPIYQYLLYRGTVPDFIPAPENLLARVPGCSYLDDKLMQRKYYYRVCAVDCRGGQGPIFPPVPVEIGL